jgi:hypothetical protein
MKTERCERCPKEDTNACSVCQSEPGQEEMTLTYTFTINEEIYGIDGLHSDLDGIIEALGFEVVSSKLESPDEETEHDFREGEI